MPWNDDEIAGKIARDIQPGWIINLGIGIPTLVAAHLTSPDVLVHSENGILGMGPQPEQGAEDWDIIDAGKNAATIVPGAAFMDSATSFSLIRGGRLDLSLMGAYQVSTDGALANWRLPDRRVGGIGGAADLVVGAKNVWVAMRHYSKDGQSKLVKQCTYPVTAAAVVSRVYSDQGIFDLVAGRVRTLELAPGVASDFDPVGAAAQWI